MLIGYVSGSQVDGRLIVTPNNTAVLSGHPAVLRCRSDEIRSLEWYRALVDGTIIDKVVDDGCELWEHSSVYGVISDGEGRHYCDLFIHNTTSSLTGLYTCDDRSDRASANVTVIGVFVSMLHRFFSITVV